MQKKKKKKYTLVSRLPFMSISPLQNRKAITNHKNKTCMFYGTQ